MGQWYDRNHNPRRADPPRVQHAASQRLSLPNVLLPENWAVTPSDRSWPEAAVDCSRSGGSPSQFWSGKGVSNSRPDLRRSSSLSSACAAQLTSMAATNAAAVRKRALGHIAFPDSVREYRRQSRCRAASDAAISCDQRMIVEISTFRDWTKVQLSYQREIKPTSTRDDVRQSVSRIVSKIENWDNSRLFAFLAVRFTDQSPPSGPVQWPAQPCTRARLRSRLQSLYEDDMNPHDGCV